LDDRPGGGDISIDDAERRPAEVKPGFLHDPVELPEPRNHPVTLRRAQVGKNHVGGRFERNPEQFVVYLFSV
ncbi:MAG: hypothetical protein ACP5E2_17060, partial [Terracidiphilus sp.]